MSDVPLIVDPAVVVVDRRRHGEWRRKAAAAAISAALLLIVGMAAMSHSRSRADINGDLLAAANMEFGRVSQPQPPSRHSRIVSKEKKFARNTAAVRSHLSVYATRGDQSLAQYMADKSPHDFPLLAAKDVTRARACPQDMLCSFKGAAKMSSHTEVEQFDPVMTKKQGDSAAKTDMDVWFDIFETNAEGCIHGHVTYELNITKIKTDDLHVDEHSDDKGDMHKDYKGRGKEEDDASLMMAFRRSTFLFVQDTQTGHYTQFIAPADENANIVNVKRSLVTDLNPIIKLADESMAASHPDGSKLFQMAFKGINGFQRTVYKIKHHPTEAGTHEINHFTRLIQEDNERNQELLEGDEDDYPDENVDDLGKSGNDASDEEKEHEIPEPESCPYGGSSKSETEIGKSSGSAKVKGDAVEEIESDADMAVGQNADKKNNPKPFNNAAKDEEEQGQEPVKGKADMVATYKSRRLSTRMFPSACSSPAQMQTAHAGAPGEAVKTMTLAEFNEHVPTPKQIDTTTQDGEEGHRMVRRSFSSMPLREESNNEDYADEGNMAQQVQELVEDITRYLPLEGKRKRGLQPGQARKLREACEHGSFRRDMMTYLRRDTSKVWKDQRKQHHMAVVFLGACEASAHKRGTQEDLLSLTNDKAANPWVRNQALMSLAGIKCPSMTTLTSVYTMGRTHPTGLGSSALLVLGALLKNSRKCKRSSSHANTKVQAMERSLNVLLHKAITAKSPAHVETILYAMRNSGAGHHFASIKQSLTMNSEMIRSVGVKEAALTAVQSIGYAATGSPSGGPEHQQLLMELNTPLEPAELWPHEMSQELIEAPHSNGTHHSDEKLVNFDTQELKSKKGKKRKKSDKSDKGKTCETFGMANIFCYGKNLPEDSTVSSANNVKIGLGKGLMYADDQSSCTNFLDVTLSTDLELELDIGIDAFDPFTIPLAQLTGQLLFKADKQGRTLAGAFTFLDVVLYSFGADVITPCPDGPEDDDEDDDDEDDDDEDEDEDSSSAEEDGEANVGKPGSRYTMKTGPGYEIDGGGWTLVRRVPANYGKWHPANDNAHGWDEYGVQDYMSGDSQAETGPWSLNWEQAVPGYDEVLFATGDGTKWMIMPKEWLYKYAANGHLLVTKSSWNPKPHGVRMYNRIGHQPDDPWIDDLGHWHTKERMLRWPKEAGGGYCFLYHGGNYNGGDYAGASSLNCVRLNGGANVFVRNSKNPDYGNIAVRPGTPSDMSDTSFLGYCGFNKDDFEGASVEKEKQVNIPKVHGAFFTVGPVKISLYAYFLGTAEAGLKIAVEEDVGELRGGGLNVYGNVKEECDGGGYAGALGGEAIATFDVGGQMQCGIFKASLGLEILLVSIEVYGTGELLSGGFSKQVNFVVKALNGQIMARLYIWWIRCWWGRCLTRIWGNCVFKIPNCAFYWRQLFSRKLWGWDSVLNTGNLFCGKFGNFGCAVYEPSPIAELLTKIRSVVRAGVAHVSGYARYAPTSLMCLDELTESCSATETSKKLDVSRNAKLYIDPAPSQSLSEEGGEDELADDDLKCDYMTASAYRGYADVAADGNKCLPWPKHYTWDHHGTGVAKDAWKCDDYSLKRGSLCWQECLRSLETNSYCRSPGDASEPYCRTGGTEENPTFSTCSQLTKCKQINEGFTHEKLDATDYDGKVSWTISGKTCDMWESDEKYQAKAKHWENHCRNPDGEKKTAWCLVRANSDDGWEYCDVGIASDDPEASQEMIDQLKVEGAAIKAKEAEERAKMQVGEPGSKDPDEFGDPSEDDSDPSENKPLNDKDYPYADSADQKVIEKEFEQAPSSSFPKQGLAAHFTAAGWGKTSRSTWDDESGNSMHSVSVTGQVRQGFAKGKGANHRIPFVSGDAQTSVTFPFDSIPAEFTICSLSRYSEQSAKNRVIGAAGRDDWFHGHHAGSAGVARYGKWMTKETQKHIIADDWLVMCGQNGADPMLLAGGKEVDVAKGGDGGVQLAINDQSATAKSAWQVSLISVWSRHLSQAEMWEAFKAYSKYLSDGPKFGVMGLAPQITFPTDGIYSHFTPDGFGKSQLGQWDDASGNGRHSVSATGHITKDFGVGSSGSPTANIFYLKGTSETSILFDSASVPTEFTICSLTRYAGAKRGQILAAADKDWFHGHSDGKAGVAFYGSWVTDPEKTEAKPAEWLVMCGQNAFDPIVLANGMEVEKGSGGSGFAQLSINQGQEGGEKSDWAVHGFTVWNRHLSRDEITAASMTYLRYLEEGGDGIHF